MIKVAAIASLLFFFLPIVGLVLSLLTVLLTRKTGGWPKKVGSFSLILSGLVSAMFLFILLTRL